MYDTGAASAGAGAVGDNGVQYDVAGAGAGAGDAAEGPTYALADSVATSDPTYDMAALAAGEVGAAASGQPMYDSAAAATVSVGAATYTLAAESDVGGDGSGSSAGTVPHLYDLGIDKEKDFC